MTTGAAARFFDYSRSYNFLQKVALEGGGTARTAAWAARSATPRGIYRVGN